MIKYLILCSLFVYVTCDSCRFSKKTIQTLHDDAHRFVGMLEEDTRALNQSDIINRLYSHTCDTDAMECRIQLGVGDSRNRMELIMFYREGDQIKSGQFYLRENATMYDLTFEKFEDGFRVRKMMSNDILFTMKDLDSSLLEDGVDSMIQYTLELMVLFKTRTFAFRDQLRERADRLFFNHIQYLKGDYHLEYSDGFFDDEFFEARFSLETAGYYRCGQRKFGFMVLDNEIDLGMEIMEDRQEQFKGIL